MRRLPFAAPVLVTLCLALAACSDAMATPTDRPAGASRVDAHRVEQVWVPAGRFVFGSPASTIAPPAWVGAEPRSEQPAHEVHIGRGFWLDRTEVTVEAYATFVKAGGYARRSLWSDDGWAWLGGQDVAKLPQRCIEETARQPQVCVTWYEAQAYAAWRGGRLPTEAEWEYAARGAQSTVYPWGDAFDPARANLGDATGPVAVGSYPAGASWVGALDLAGNAMEWVADWYSLTDHGAGVVDDPTGPSSGSIKIEKGGWWGAPDPAYVSRAAYRHFEDPPFYSDQHIGFRIVTDGP